MTRGLLGCTSGQIGARVGHGMTGKCVIVAIIGIVIVTRVSSNTVMDSSLVMVTIGSTVMMAEI